MQQIGRRSMMSHDEVLGVVQVLCEGFSRICCLEQGNLKNVHRVISERPLNWPLHSN